MQPCIADGPQIIVMHTDGLTLCWLKSHRDACSHQNTDCRLMVRSNVRRARGVGRNDELIRLLDEFVKATVTAEFDPPLTADETTYLEDLRAHV